MPKHRANRKGFVPVPCARYRDSWTLAAVVALFRALAVWGCVYAAQLAGMSRTITCRLRTARDSRSCRIIGQAVLDHVLFRIADISKSSASARSPRADHPSRQPSGLGFSDAAMPDLQ